MAVVILSAGTMTRAGMRTVSTKSVAGVVSASMLLILAGGFALGYGYSNNYGRETGPAVSRDSADLVSAEEWAPTLVEAAMVVEIDGASLGEDDDSAPNANSNANAVIEAVVSENRYLIDRFGELSGRVIQLEAEAMELVARIGAINEFEARIKSDELGADPKGRVAKTPPGAPAGGPLLPAMEPRGEAPLPEAVGAPDALTGEVWRLSSEIDRVSDMLARIDRIATSFNLFHMSFPGRQPVQEIAFTSGFGNRPDPFTRRRAFHSGVDYPAPTGTPIYASAGGLVIFAGKRSNYGYTVEIEHGAGLVTRYAHASTLLVRKDQVVMPGEKIALIGSTGRSTGPHLHFEILKDGRFVDPTVYLARF